MSKQMQVPLGTMRAERRVFERIAIQKAAISKPPIRSQIGMMQVSERNADSVYFMKSDPNFWIGEMIEFLLCVVVLVYGIWTFVS